VHEQDGHVELVGAGDRVEVFDVDRRRQAREASAPRTAEEPHDPVAEFPRQSERLALEPEDVDPVDRGRVEDDAHEPLADGRRAQHGLQHDRPAHRPPHEHDALGPAVLRVATAATRSAHSVPPSP
jgi:hypothetical protein